MCQSSFISLLTCLYPLTNIFRICLQFYPSSHPQWKNIHMIIISSLVTFVPSCRSADNGSLSSVQSSGSDSSLSQSTSDRATPLSTHDQTDNVDYQPTSPVWKRKTPVSQARFFVRLRQVLYLSVNDSFQNLLNELSPVKFFYFCFSCLIKFLFPL